MPSHTAMQHLRACAQIVRLCCAFMEGHVRRQAWRLSRLHLAIRSCVVRVLDSGEELKATMCRGPESFGNPQLDAGRERTKSGNQGSGGRQTEGGSHRIGGQAEGGAAHKEAPRCRFHREPEIRQNVLQTIASSGNQTQLGQQGASVPVQRSVFESTRASREMRAFVFQALAES